MDATTIRAAFLSSILLACHFEIGSARGQSQTAPSATPPNHTTMTAKVEVQALELTSPERYALPSILEPVRHVTLVATSDSILRSQDAKAGTSVRESQEVAQLDRSEAIAKLKIAQAAVKEEKALLDQYRGEPIGLAIAEAHLEAAQARADLAQLELDRATIRAPFSGKIVNSPLSDGQFVEKGTMIADLVDVSSLKILLPLSQATAKAGGTVSITHDGATVEGKIQALVPLPESYAVLHELATSYTGAWLIVDNSDGRLEIGRRLRSPDLPALVLATVPDQSITKSGENNDQYGVQVLRNEYVVNLEVKRFGSVINGSSQIGGKFRKDDRLIVSASVLLQPGTLVRFAPNMNTLEGTNPNPNIAGTTAELVPPKLGGRAAPIGPPGSAMPKASGAKKGATRTPASRSNEERSPAKSSSPPASEPAPF